jgi:hypothetical protein
MIFLSVIVQNERAMLLKKTIHSTLNVNEGKHFSRNKSDYVFSGYFLALNVKFASLFTVPF